MNRTSIDWARDTALTGDPASVLPETVLFLLREYVSGGVDAVRDSAEQGLTHGLDAGITDADPCRRIQWLRVLADAAAVSDDERLKARVAEALPSAIDALESRVRRTYEPGEGLLDQSCGAQLQCGSALLAAFDLSGRLPYAMLAEELLQQARSRWWNDERATYDTDFADNCVALRVLCGLVGLHADPSYRAAAVLTPGSRCADDARRLAAVLTQLSVEHPQSAGPFGCALLEWFALESNLQ